MPESEKIVTVYREREVAKGDGALKEKVSDEKPFVQGTCDPAMIEREFDQPSKDQNQYSSATHQDLQSKEARTNENSLDAQLKKEDVLLKPAEVTSLQVLPVNLVNYIVCGNEGKCTDASQRIAARPEAKYCSLCGYQTIVVSSAPDTAVTIVREIQSKSQLEVKAIEKTENTPALDINNPLSLIRAGKYDFYKAKKIYIGEFEKRLRDILKNDERFIDSHLIGGNEYFSYHFIKPTKRTVKIRGFLGLGKEREVIKTEFRKLLTISNNGREFAVHDKNVANDVERILGELEKESDFGRVFNARLEINYTF